jgi:hypothetical protein
MPETWNVEGRWRCDGLTITEGPGLGWIILPGDDRPATDTCPCCHLPIPGARNARVLADKLYPLQEAA